MKFAKWASVEEYYLVFADHNVSTCEYVSVDVFIYSVL